MLGFLPISDQPISVAEGISFPIIEGTLSVLEEDDFLFSEGVVFFPIIGTLSVLEANDTLFTTDLTATLSVLEANDAHRLFGHSVQPPAQPKPIIGLEWESWDRMFEPSRTYI